MPYVSYKLMLYTNIDSSPNELEYILFDLARLLHRFTFRELRLCLRV